MRNKKIVITGGTGFLGQALIGYLGKENDIVVLSRGYGNASNNLYANMRLTAADGFRVRYLEWMGVSQEHAWVSELDGADVVINLAGKSVNCRYHSRQKKAILESRINATKAIGEAIRLCKVPPALWINAASATIYSHSLLSPNDEYNGVIRREKVANMPFNLLDEIRYRKNRIIAAIRWGRNSPEYSGLSTDFSVDVCQKWENEFFGQPVPGTRKIALRSAIILDNAGVLVPYIRLCKAGLGGRHGNGQQRFSWVHAEDVARMIDWLWENEKEGVYNCASPTAVTNSVLMKQLRKELHIPFGLPAPAWLLELGAWLIGTETELMLKSRWVVPAKAMDEGFTFKYPTIDVALREILGRDRR